MIVLVIYVKKDHIKNIIPNIKIQKESNIQLNELTLTSKMIIKIQTEIVKKNMLNIIKKSINIHFYYLLFIIYK